ncbi:hypothetical protein FZEAL_6151 [Fusarium zealandicum]|uniref:Ankyrin n=1 Tax=Fusarium zealandicum TaxID=1053134 RepID=A0A8H4XJ63_9HYPO|nr:hypothetical protein FZEAL_6151 [Fusarium zealandicum]
MILRDPGDDIDAVNERVLTDFHCLLIARGISENSAHLMQKPLSTKTVLLNISDKNGQLRNSIMKEDMNQQNKGTHDVDAYMAAGADATMKNCEGNTATTCLSMECNGPALSVAIQSQGGNNFGTVQILFDAMADVNGLIAAQSGRGALGRDASVWPQETPLLVVIGVGNRKMVEFIMKNGGNADQAARRGMKRTPLQKACKIGSFKMVELLVSWEAKVNDPPSLRGGGTALKLASGTDSIRIVRLLLSRGADAHAPTSDVHGRSTLEAEAENGCLDMLKALWDATNSLGFLASEIERAINLAKRKG